MAKVLNDHYDGDRTCSSIRNPHRIGVPRHLHIGTRLSPLRCHRQLSSSNYPQRSLTIILTTGLALPPESLLNKFYKIRKKELVCLFSAAIGSSCSHNGAGLETQNLHLHSVLLPRGGVFIFILVRLLQTSNIQHQELCSSFFVVTNNSIAPRATKSLSSLDDCPSAEGIYNCASVESLLKVTRPMPCRCLFFVVGTGNSYRASTRILSLFRGLSFRQGNLHLHSCGCLLGRGNFSSAYLMYLS